VVFEDTTRGKATLSIQMGLHSFPDRQLTVQDPDRFPRLFQGPGNSPHVSTAIYIPLDIVSVPLRREATIAMLVVVMHTITAHGPLMSMAMCLSFASN